MLYYDEIHEIFLIVYITHLIIFKVILNFNYINKNILLHVMQILLMILLVIFSYIFSFIILL
jgi:hypothetical protein